MAFLRQEFWTQRFSSPEDLSKLVIPETFDLIWVGSVFTHIDWRRCEILAEKLLNALESRGALIAAFRGQGCLDRMLGSPGRFNMNGYYDRLFEDYHRTGYGYMDYKGFVNWGQNLFRHERIREIAPRDDIARH